LPKDHGDANGAQCASLNVRIEERLRAQLAEWCRLRRTTVALAVFTAFVALVLRSSKVHDAVVRFQSDGRYGPLLQDSVGYFASVLNLRMQLNSDDRFTDLLARVTEEYCAATEHADSSYVDAQVPEPQFTRNCAFNWVPQPLTTPSSSPSVFPFERYDFPMPLQELEHYEWDHEPIMLLFDQGHVVEGRIIYSPRDLSTQAMERFRDDFLALIEALLRTPAQPVCSVALTM
jgi:hypothetical protein